MTQSAILAENLTKVFGRGKSQVKAVNGLSLEIHPGQVYGFLGPNGAGKSTTIRMLLDLIHPTSGRALIYGQPVTAQHEVIEKRVGALVERATFYEFMTARQNLTVLAQIGQYSDDSRIEALLELVNLTEAADRRVKGFSTGMRQRLGIASTMLHDPDLIILDEPTNGLDPKGIQEIRNLIRRLVDEEGKTVFLSSHILPEVEQVCDRVAIINKGKLVKEGAVAELLSDHVTLRVEAQPHLKATEILNQHWPAEANGTWITVQARREDSPHIVRTLTEQQVDVYQIITQRRTLEEYFLDVTGSTEGATPHD